jgi:hypothetical protein
MWKNKAIRYTWLTLVLYAVLIGLADWFEHLAPSGPCNPGGGIMLVLLSPFLIIPFLLISLIRTLQGHRRHLGPTLIHIITMTFFIFVVVIR